MSTKEEFTKSYNKITSRIGSVFCLTLIVFIASPFIWIWHDLILALKVGVSAFILLWVIGGVHYIFKEAYKEGLEEFTERDRKVSKFHERMAGFQNERSASGS